MVDGLFIAALSRRRSIHGDSLRHLAISKSRRSLRQSATLSKMDLKTRRSFYLFCFLTLHSSVAICRRYNQTHTHCACVQIKHKSCHQKVKQERRHGSATRSPSLSLSFNPLPYEAASLILIVPVSGSLIIRARIPRGWIVSRDRTEAPCTFN